MKNENKTWRQSRLEDVDGDMRLTGEIIKIVGELAILSEETRESETKEKLKDIQSQLFAMWEEAFKLRTRLYRSLRRIDRLEEQLDFRKKHPIKKLLGFK